MGCKTPTYTNASPEQKQELIFTYDSSYNNSVQYNKDINDSVNTIEYEHKIH